MKIVLKAGGGISMPTPKLFKDEYFWKTVRTYRIEKSSILKKRTQYSNSSF